MDVAYDRIQEEALPDGTTAGVSKDSNSKGQQRGDLKTELGDAYKAFSDSSWGATLGGLWGTVRQRVGVISFLEILLPPRILYSHALNQTPR